MLCSLSPFYTVEYELNSVGFLMLLLEVCHFFLKIGIGHRSVKKTLRSDVIDPKLVYKRNEWWLFDQFQTPVITAPIQSAKWSAHHYCLSCTIIIFFYGMEDIVCFFILSVIGRRQCSWYTLHADCCRIYTTMFRCYTLFTEYFLATYFILITLTLFICILFI